MRMTAGSAEARRAAGTRNVALALGCVVCVSLLALAGCAAAIASDDRSPFAVSVSTGGEDTREAYSIRVPDDWNGQVVVLMHGPVLHRSASSTATLEGSVASELLDRRLAVATPTAHGDGVVSVSGSGRRLSIHFVLGYGVPTRAYLIGMSQGEYVALATIAKSAGELDRVLVYAPGGFVHAAFLELQNVRTIELALRANESTAGLLSSRLEIDRSDLADTLYFYYALLTGARTSGSVVRTIPARETPGPTSSAWRSNTPKGDLR